jgi:hypothetical protein
LFLPGTIIMLSCPHLPQLRWGPFHTPQAGEDKGRVLASSLGTLRRDPEGLFFVGERRRSEVVPRYLSGRANDKKFSDSARCHLGLTDFASGVQNTME